MEFSQKISKKAGSFRGKKLLESGNHVDGYKQRRETFDPVIQLECGEANLTTS